MPGKEFAQFFNYKLVQRLVAVHGRETERDELQHNHGHDGSGQNGAGEFHEDKNVMPAVSKASGFFILVAAGAGVCFSCNLMNAARKILYAVFSPETAVFVAVFAVGALMMFHPMVFSGFAMMQVDQGDTRFNHYLLEHGYRWLLSGLPWEEFWDAGFFFPAKNVIAYSDAMLGVALPYWLARFSGAAPERALQCWYFISVFLNYASFYLLARRWLTRSALAAAAGAFLFSFAAARVNQTGHQQLVGQYYAVLGLYALFWLLSDEGSARPRAGRRRFWIAAFFGGFVLQFYGAFYFGWFMFFFLAAAFAVGLALAGGRRRIWILFKTEWFFIILIGALAALSLVPLVQQYLAAARDVGCRRFENIRDLVPPVQAWFHMGPWSVPYAWLGKLKIFRMIVSEHEQRLGLGLLTSVLVVLGYRAGWRDKKTRLVAVVSAVTVMLVVILSSQIKGHTLWRYVFSVFPGADAIRAFGRIGVFMLLFHGLAVVFFFNVARHRRTLFVIFALLCAAEQLVHTPSYDWRAARQQVSRLAGQVAGGGDAACLSFVFTPVISGRSFEYSWKYHVDAMWAALETGVPTVNGYSGNHPPAWPLEHMVIKNARDDHTVTGALKKWKDLHGLHGPSHCRIKLDADHYEPI